MITPPVTKTKTPPPSLTKPLGPSTATITTTPYPKWWKESQTAPINLSDAGTQEVIKPQKGYTIYIATIVVSVSKETNISFLFGIFGETGSLNFGGTDEPRGMVIAMGQSPAPCGPGPFKVTSDGPGAAVGGFVTYYLETEQKRTVPKTRL